MAHPMAFPDLRRLLRGNRPAPFPGPRTVAVWLGLSAGAGVLAGAACALFLAALDRATSWREGHPWVIGLLPLGGLAIGLLYHAAGRTAERGTALVLEEIHDPRAVLPLRMAPMILLGTVATHLFGGSAGREGTAAQMGASLADQVSGVARLDGRGRRILLMAGLSGGFGAVFGTPLAGMVFGIEVLALGRLRVEGLPFCLAAALVGDRVATALGARHTHYGIAALPDPGAMALLAAAAVGVACGLAGRVFIRLTHAVRDLAARFIAWPPLRLVVGGAIVALAVLALGTTRHIGLGIPVLVGAFAASTPPADIAIKLALTAITLGSGFKGGEVTPLFVIGATLGSALAVVLPLPVDVLAALGFVALFAGAARTPITCVVLAMEVFEPGLAPHAGIACVCSWLVSARDGIYRIAPERAPAPIDAGATTPEIPERLA
jgi:H+/Cl- antiporter ClcA